MCQFQLLGWRCWLVLLSTAQGYLGLVINESLLIVALTSGLHAYIHRVPGSSTLHLATSPTRGAGAAVLRLPLNQSDELTLSTFHEYIAAG